MSFLKNTERITICIILSFVISPCFFITDIQAATTLQTLRQPSNNLGLVGLWSFDGPDVTTTVTDRSGQNNHGYFSGGATTTAKVMGKIGQALRFDGVDDTVTFSSDLIGTGNVTTCAWVYLNAPMTNGAYQTIFNTVYYAMSYYFASPDYYISVTSNDSNAHLSQLSSNPVRVWNHICNVRPGAASTNTTVYLNGVSLGAGNDGDPASAFNLSIGGDNQNARQYFNGKIDDPRIYNRLLTATEIKQLYNIGR